MQRREQIVVIRKQERLFVLLTMTVSAVGSLIWLPLWASALWFALGAVIMVLSAGLLESRYVSPQKPWLGDVLMAGVTLVGSVWFMSLPLALVLRGDAMATLAGVSIAGGLILRGANEYTLSKAVGGSALGAIFITALIGAVWRPIPAPPIEVAAVIGNVAVLFSHVVLNASSRRRAEEGMAAALERAEQNRREAQLASEAKSSFVAMMSHEIRTPLNGLVGMAQAMDTAGLTQRQLDQLKVIQTSGAALHAILNDVLDLSKIEAGKLEPASAPFAATDICGDVADVFAAVAERRGLAFKIDVTDAARGRFLGDAARLRQIITNLISNAIKFTDAGTVSLSIDYAAETLTIVVTDTGVGIPEADQTRLFDKFVQIDPSPTRRHGGTGLGLAITRALCELMRGRIEVMSRPGEGSRFTVALPMARAPAAEIEAAPDARPEALIAVDLKVLAAEDNPVNQIVLKTLLEQVGVHPTLVVNGQEALEAWRAEPWDVILMDIQMPVMDGLAAAQAIRAEEALLGRGRTLIFALTADAMAHQMKSYAGADMDGCITKPIDARDLFAAMSSAAAAVDEKIAAARVG